MQLEIPLYTAEFIDNKNLIVGGGGGAGKHGIPNKIISVSVDVPLKVNKDVELVNSDCPTALAVYENTIYVGANPLSAPETISSGAKSTKLKKRTKKVAGLRTFDEDLNPIDAFAALHSTDSSVYYRAIAAGKDKVAVGSGGVEPGELNVLKSGKELWTKPLQVVDLCWNSDCTLLSVVTDKTLYVYKGSKEVFKVDVPDTKPATTWVRAQFGLNGLVASRQQRANKKVELFLFDTAYSQIKCVQLHGVSAISSLAASNALVTIGSPAGDLYVLNDRLKICKKRIGAHKLPVTAVCINKDSTCIASVAIDGTIHAEVLNMGERSIWFTILWVLLSALVVLILAGVGIKIIISNTSLPKRLAFVPAFTPPIPPFSTLPADV